MSDFARYLIHSPKSFLRETLEDRMESCGVRNIMRMELFLWDLEIFLQLQSILGDRMILKGGAAVQFYLPINYQRTSVDIDVLFYGTYDDIESAIIQIEEKFNADGTYFKFYPHIPKKPKTRLPLVTYYIDVPSVLMDHELRVGVRGSQQIKVEFIIRAEQAPINRVKGDNIFAVASDKEYNILPINHLLADKLTTLGPTTIGIQDHRMDEQVKQLYDIHALLLFNFEDLDFETIRKIYKARGASEAQNRDIDYEPESILQDVYRQIDRLRKLDSGSSGSKITWKYIADFLSLYAGRNAIRTPSAWAVVGEQLYILVSLLFKTSGGKDEMARMIFLDKFLLFEHLNGLERGQQILIFKEKLIAQYGHLADMPTAILKGKNLSRIFWAIIRPENLDEIEGFIKANVKEKICINFT